ncbi:MAG: CoA transferase subunit A [Endozoicomonas sp.]
MLTKPIISPEQAAQKVITGNSMMIGGFMATGSPHKIIDALIQKGTKELNLICTDTGFADKGIGRLISAKQVASVKASHIGLNPETGRQMTSGEIDVELIPQGTLAESIRCGGAGIGGFLTKTGIGTLVEENKQKVTVKDEEYLLELPLKADVALIRASIVDTVGNCIFNKTTSNFNPVMATAADLVIVEAEKVVEVGEIDPDRFTLPGIFIDFIVA